MPYVEAARQRHPWLAKFSQGYIVHGYQAFKDLVSMDDQMRPGLGPIVEFYEAQGTPWGEFNSEMLLAQSGPVHKRLRDSVATAFTPRRANNARPLMRQVISDLMEEWVPRGEFDFAEFASYFPVAVMCGLLGVSAEPIPRIRTALENQMASVSMNRALRPQIMAGYDVLWNFVDNLVVEREKQGASDENSTLDALMATQKAGLLSDKELRYLLIVLLVAGYDTSKNMLTMTMNMMLEHPDIWARCAGDKEFCRKVLDEMLRHSSIATFFRTTRVDIEYDGVHFPSNTILAFATPLTGRDPSVFPEPMKFDPDRVCESRHMAFGRGAHICLGQFIARNQLEEGLHLIAQRVTGPRLVGEVTWRPFLGAWGLQTLPIAFEPAPLSDNSRNEHNEGTT